MSSSASAVHKRYPFKSPGSQQGTTLFVAGILLLFASLAVLAASRGAIVMEQVSSNIMLKSIANGQSETAIARIMSDNTVLLPLVSLALSGQGNVEKTVNVTFAGDTNVAKVNLKLENRPIKNWSLDQLNTIIIHTQSEVSSTDEYKARSTIEPSYVRVVPAI